MWKHTPIILSLRRLRQENWDFDTSLAYLVRPISLEGMKREGRRKGKEKKKISHKNKHFERK
jgi:hypothetical protein